MADIKKEMDTAVKLKGGKVLKNGKHVVMKGKGCEYPPEEEKKKK